MPKLKRDTKRSTLPKQHIAKRKLQGIVGEQSLTARTAEHERTQKFAQHQTNPHAQKSHIDSFRSLRFPVKPDRHSKPRTRNTKQNQSRRTRPKSKRKTTKNKTYRLEFPYRLQSPCKLAISLRNFHPGVTSTNKNTHKSLPQNVSIFHRLTRFTRRSLFIMLVRK